MNEDGSGQARVWMPGCMALLMVAGVCLTILCIVAMLVDHQVAGELVRDLLG